MRIMAVDMQKSISAQRYNAKKESKVDTMVFLLTSNKRANVISKMLSLPKRYVYIYAQLTI
jgi:hypothetical protein